jgi:RhtB (resistance to homoserine/threonine) family protein
VHVDLAPFLALSVLRIVIPGPDTAVVTKNALAGGKRGGVFAACGVAIGLTVWTLAAALGIAALLRASEVAFTALKIAGAVYLIWIGVQLLRKPGALPTGLGPAQSRRARRAVRQGLLSDLGNPKIAVFFTSFLPQFVHGGSSPFASLLLLGAIFAVLTLAWLAAYGVAIGHGTKLLRRPRVQRALDRFTGLVFLGFGVRLAFEHR